MGNIKNAFKILVRKPHNKRQTVRSRFR